MILKDLHLSNFRNYERLDFSPLAGLNVIFGPNGSGKTNVLDAIHFLSMTKSAFGIQDTFCVREGKDFFRIEGDYENKESLKVVIKYRPGTRKILEKNGLALKKISDHLGTVPVVVSGPIDMELVSGSPETRRNFLDQTISQFDQAYLDDLIRYHKLLKQKGAELKKQKENPSPILEILETYHQQMIPLNLSMKKVREGFIRDSKKSIQKYFGLIAGGAEKVEVVYRTQLESADPNDYSEKDFLKEIAAQRNLFGIHKDDLDLLVNGQPAKKFASQGQQKSVLTAMKLMQVEMIKEKGSRDPIILLDDVFDRLDRTRTKNLLSIILKNNLGQTFISDTQSERIKEALTSVHEEVGFFEVSENNIKQIKGSGKD